MKHIDALKLWREEDNDDHIWLSRHEVIQLLDEIENIHEDCI